MVAHEQRKSAKDRTGRRLYAAPGRSPENSDAGGHRNASSSQGTVTWDPVDNFFQISGIHNYMEEGNYTIDVSTANAQDATTTTIIMDAPIFGMSGSGFKFTKGVPFSVKLGQFKDGNPGAPVSDFTVTINWGDGTWTAGTVTAVQGTPGLFDVAGAHTYANSGTYMPSVGILDGGTGGSLAFFSDTATASSVPEPSSLMLLGSGILGLGVAIRRKLTT